MNKKVYGRCFICGENKKLSKEHIPPQKAFNMDTSLMASIAGSMPSGQARWRGQKSQGGFHQYTLCDKCNNDTGRWYGGAYVDFVKQCAPYAIETNAERNIDLAFRIKPLNVIKEAFAIMCSSCGVEFGDALPKIRKFVLDPNSKQRPFPLRVWLYLRAQQGGKTTGVATIVDMNTLAKQIVSEFSWWPAGWALTFDDSDIFEAREVTDWCVNYGFNEEARITFNLPCRWTHTAFPLDFRDVNSIIKTEKK